MNRKNNIGRIEVWVCRDWVGSHIFWVKPVRTNNGNPKDEWYSDLSSLDSVWNVKCMVNEFTKGWNIDHKPEEITINFETIL